MHTASLVPLFTPEAHHYTCGRCSCIWRRVTGGVALQNQIPSLNKTLFFPLYPQSTGYFNGRLFLLLSLEDRTVSLGMGWWRPCNRSKPLDAASARRCSSETPEWTMPSPRTDVTWRYLQCTSLVLWAYPSGATPLDTRKYNLQFTPPSRVACIYLFARKINRFACFFARTKRHQPPRSRSQARKRTIRKACKRTDQP